MLTVTSCHPANKQKLINCLRLPFGTTEIWSAKHVPVKLPGVHGQVRLVSLMKTMLAAYGTVTTNIELCIKEARPLTPQEWEKLDVIALNARVSSLWSRELWMDAIRVFDDFVFGPLFDMLAEVRKKGRDLDGAALAFGCGLYPSTILSPYHQVGRLAVRRLVRLMREAGRTTDEVNRFKRIAEDNIHSLTMDVGGRAGISLAGVHWINNNAQLDYIKRYGTHPARIARAGASLDLADWYIKNHSTPKSSIGRIVYLDD